jgi:hypothetical protein
MYCIGGNKSKEELDFMSVISKLRRLNGVVIQDINAAVSYVSSLESSFNENDIQTITPYLVNKLLGGVANVDNEKTIEVPQSSFFILCYYNIFLHRDANLQIADNVETKSKKKAKSDEKKKRTAESSPSPSSSPAALNEANLSFLTYKTVSKPISYPLHRFGNPPIPELYLYQAFQLSSTVFLVFFLLLLIYYLV